MDDTANRTINPGDDPPDVFKACYITLYNFHRSAQRLQLRNNCPGLAMAWVGPPDEHKPPCPP